MVGWKWQGRRFGRLSTLEVSLRRQSGAAHPGGRLRCPWDDLPVEGGNQP